MSPELSSKVSSARYLQTLLNEDRRWVTVAFTCNGLKALGVDDASLATFPEEFRQGMVARAQMLGDTGANHSDNWEAPPECPFPPIGWTSVARRALLCLLPSLETPRS